MTVNEWRDLGVLSVRNPAEGARAILALNLPREVLWPALALVSVLSTILFGLSEIVAPTGGMSVLAMIPPLAYCLLSMAALALTAFAFHRVGQWFGGSGSFDDMLALVVWLEALRVAVQAAALLVLLAIPGLSSLIVLGFSLYAIYIAAHFVDQGHGFGSLGKAAGVMMVAIFAIGIAMIVLAPMIVGLFGGGQPDV